MSDWSLKIKAIWYYHKRLYRQSLLIALLFSVAGGMIIESFSPQLFCLTYLLFSCFFQYYIYEVQHPSDYYYYKNLGLNRIHFWASTPLIAFVLYLLLNLLSWS